MTEIQKHRADEMTPVERKKAIEEGKSYDRVPCVPFMGELKGVLSGISVWDLSHDPEKMAEAEIIPFNRYGYDRMDIGPNSRGITEALGGKVIYPEKGVPYMDAPLIQDYGRLDSMEPVDARTNARIRDFARTAQILADKALPIVPVEMSIGGPLTIASNLRGVERLLRDLRPALMQDLTACVISSLDPFKMISTGSTFPAIGICGPNSCAAFSRSTILSRLTSFSSYFLK